MILNTKFFESSFLGPLYLKGFFQTSFNVVVYYYKEVLKEADKGKKVFAKGLAYSGKFSPYPFLEGQVKVFEEQSFPYRVFPRSSSQWIFPITFQDRKMGIVIVESEKATEEFPEEEVQEMITKAKLIAQKMSPLFVGIEDEPVLVRNLKALKWVTEAHALAPHLCDWIGIYYKASWAIKEDSTDLILGPFLGQPTEHVRIPLEKGLCGMALREERVVNIPDVRESNQYISCSVETKSELVIPLKDKEGNFIAELDIDGHKINSFSSEIEGRFLKFCETFWKIL